VTAAVGPEVQEAVRRVAEAFVGGRLPRWPPGARVAPHLGRAAVVAVGGAALLGPAPGQELLLECLLDPAGEEALRPEERADLDVRDPGPPAVTWRVRSGGWLRGRLEDPEALWLHQRAVVVRDPDGAFAAAVREAFVGFRRSLPRLVAERYRWFRTGLEEADRAPDPLGRRILVGRAAEAALELAILARGEPYPPPAWLAGYLERVHPEAEALVAAATRLLTDRVVERDLAARLRRLVDELLEVAGYGEGLVRGYAHRV
jgi:hypothetical protein